jgi:TonB family protein
MRRTKYVYLLLALTAAGLWAEDTVSPVGQHHQTPDEDGIYYAGPEVRQPKLVRTFSVPYPAELSKNEVQGMTVLAMAINASGKPEHIQLLHKHGEPFDEAAIAAVKHSTFEPGMLDDKPVPVWIDVRVVFYPNRGQGVPEVLISERDLPPPDESQLLDKHRNPLSYTPPFLIHTVDADFADPFAAHPYVQVAVVSVLVGEDGLPKEVHVKRGLGFGLDQKAEAAVWQYRFLPATKKGRPLAALQDVMVGFARF